MTHITGLTHALVHHVWFGSQDLYDDLGEDPSVSESLHWRLLASGGWRRADLRFGPWTLWGTRSWRAAAGAGDADRVLTVGEREGRVWGFVCAHRQGPWQGGVVWRDAADTSWELVASSAEAWLDSLSQSRVSFHPPEPPEEMRTELPWDDPSHAVWRLKWWKRLHRLLLSLKAPRWDYWMEENEPRLVYGHLKPGIWYRPLFGCFNADIVGVVAKRRWATTVEDVRIVITSFADAMGDTTGGGDSAQYPLVIAEKLSDWHAEAVAGAAFGPVDYHQALEWSKLRRWGAVSLRD